MVIIQGEYVSNLQWVRKNAVNVLMVSIVFRNRELNIDCLGSFVGEMALLWSQKTPEEESVFSLITQHFMAMIITDPFRHAILTLPWMCSHAPRISRGCEIEGTMKHNG